MDWTSGHDEDPLLHGRDQEGWPGRKVEAAHRSQDRHRGSLLHESVLHFKLSNTEFMYEGTKMFKNIGLRSLLSLLKLSLFSLVKVRITDRF